MPLPRSVAVIGGGLTGLAAAYRLREQAAGLELPLQVTVFESSDRLGGALATIHRDGFIVETGADSFLSEKPAGLRLIERLGLADQLVRTQEQFRRTMVVRGGRLVPIPDGFSMIAPTYLWPVLRSSLFSPLGKARMLLEPLIPRRRSPDDESIAAFVTRRVGREVLERVAQPLAGGIYTGDPSQLSAASTLPRFLQMERQYGSLTRGLRAAARMNNDARATSGARWSLFVSLRTGVGQLVGALTDRLADSLRVGATAQSLHRVDQGWRLRLADGSSAAADVIICAIPAHPAAALLDSHDALLAADLRAIPYASASVVNLAWRSHEIPRLPPSFGFVAPAIEHRRIIAGSFSSLKFAGRAPEGMLLARAFLGGVLNQHMMSLPDETLIAAAIDECRDLLGITAPPLFTDLHRWPASMPQYVVGHLQRAERIRARAAALPNLILTGAYLDGVGIPDCIRQGEAAADSVITKLRASLE